MLKQADVLAENFRPGTMEKLGLSWERLQEINPRLIYASSSGFGHTGPLKDAPAYDTIIQAMSGIMMEQGTLMLRQCVLVPLLRIYAAVFIYSAE